MDSGIYIRVDKENKLLEEMTTKEREDWLDDLDRGALYRTMHILCDVIRGE